MNGDLAAVLDVELLDDLLERVFIRPGNDRIADDFDIFKDDVPVFVLDQFARGYGPVISPSASEPSDTGPN